MVSKIINLTRTVMPKITANPKAHLEAVYSMPEMVLNKMTRNGDKSIVHVNMNQCAAARISENGVNTIYTDGLCGCNSVGVIAKCLDGRPLAILSHYVPTNNADQLKALETQLSKYDYYIDKNFKPKLLMNIGGYEKSPGQLETCPNPLVEKVKDLVSRFFPKGADTNITPYPTKGRGAFFSSANIYQFDPADINKVKVTNVGEKESFIDLNV